MTRARGRDADMTQGNILRQYIDFALPLTVGLLFQQLYSAVDSIVVGNFVGETALGAVGSTGNIINMLIGVCNGLSLGAGAVISQAYGAKNHERISKAVHTTMLMTFLLCIVATAVGVAIVKPSLQLMRTPDSMLVEATEYLTIYFEGIAGLLIYNMGSAILRAVGDSRRPLYFLVFSAVVNTVLDLLLHGCGRCGVCDDYRTGGKRGARAVCADEGERVLRAAVEQAAHRRADDEGNPDYRPAREHPAGSDLVVERVRTGVHQRPW